MVASEKPKPYKTPTRCERPESAEQENLCIERGAARAAEDQAYWARLTFWIGVAGTSGVVLTLFATAWAAWAAQRSAQAAEVAVSHAQTATVAQLRAYVSLKKIDFLDGKNGRRIQPIWQNVGETPTRRALNQINYFLDGTDIPDGFDFPDPSTPPFPTLLGNGQEMPYDGPSLSVPDFNQIATGQTHFYVYGWFEYSDVFIDTPRHRSEFCAKLVVGDNKWMFRNHSRFNGQDEDCYRQPQT
jgi:hypothetical protein